MLRRMSFADSVTGLPILAVGLEGTDTAHHYMTAMTWLSDSRHLIVHAGIDREKLTGSVVRFDTETGDAQVLEEGFAWGRGVVSCDDVLYLFDRNELYAIDAWSGERRTVCRLKEHCVIEGPLSITNDGRTLGVYWSELNHEAALEGSPASEAAAAAGKCWVIGTVDTASGEVREAIRPLFAEPYPVANHAMVSPVDPEMVFYCHEGATEHIPDRLWVIDTRTGETRNIFPQKRDESGRHVEYVGHEIWSFDGSGLYFVKYAHSPDQPAGVYFADKWGERHEFVNGDYRYWHVGISPDGRYAAADTQEPGKSKIVLIDTATKRSELLCELPCRGVHPGHPHPSFSPDSRKVTFTFSDEHDALWVGVMKVSDGNRLGGEGDSLALEW
ncbi:TolB family protein [Paenibacillus sp. MBLB4367]|uniref:TolB family protein n=1 Tax=Paenibacillus sp. MBLB4367 TaxID=3384767 RepID=UPI00390839F0